MDLIRAKGSVCVGEKSRWMEVERMPSGARRILPHLFAFGGNGYLLLSAAGEGLAIDPTVPDMLHLEDLLRDIGVRRIGAVSATHYLRDHSDALTSCVRATERGCGCIRGWRTRSGTATATTSPGCRPTA